MAKKAQKAAKTSKDPRSAAVDAALRLASKRDWANVTLADIAKEAKVKLADLSQMFECREDIVSAYSRRVDAAVLEVFENGDGEERERIFDILMERFDRLNDDRDAVVSILGAVCADPKQLVIGLPHVARSIAWMLEACGVETQGWKGAARVAGITGIYVWALRTWRSDESADMGKTMARLDRLLGQAQRVSGTFNL